MVKEKCLKSASRKFTSFLLVAAGLQCGICAAHADVTVTCQLPPAAKLPATYRASLAIVDAKNPDWIISNFVSGATCTVTEENKGRFTESWDGLDDNFMPVPPGTYGVKGIFMPAEKWKVDGEFHTLMAQFAGAGSDWAPSLTQDMSPLKIQGDPVGQPLSDVDVAPSGKGVLLFNYLENARNNYSIDFSQPTGYEQLGAGFNSGGAAGGPAVCTDGETIWSFEAAGDQPFIYRADGKPFGSGRGRYRSGVYLPEGWISGLAAWRSTSAAGPRTFVFAAERGRILANGRENPDELANKVIVLDGQTAEEVAQWTVDRPQSVVARNGNLYVLHHKGEGFEISQLHLTGDWARAALQPVFEVPKTLVPFDLEVDSHGRFYLSDAAANHVYELDGSGRMLVKFGRGDEQKTGSYDPNTLMQPEKLGLWTNARGEDRLIIIEAAGPNRMSEWDATGNLVREWVVPQTLANGGYAVDPRQADRIYLPGQGKYLVRWRVDYKTGKWTTDAVWPGLVTPPVPGNHLSGGDNQFPRIIYRGDTRYLVFGRTYTVYREEGNSWRASAAIATKADGKRYIWRDANGDGKAEESEYSATPMTAPPGAFRYWGESWMDDLSLVAIGNGTPDIWQLKPSGFDVHGNPIYAPDGWKKIITDPVFAARAAGTADAVHGGNELDETFSSAWAQVAAAPDGGFYVAARGGPNFSANNGAQFKLSRYVPDGKGGYSLKWRTGRVALQGNAKPGEVYGPIYVTSPVNGLVGVTDNTRAGYVVYTEDGMYVDTILADGRVIPADKAGVYLGPAEFFGGYHYLNPQDHQVYLAFGKTFPVLYSIKNWVAQGALAEPLTLLTRTVTLRGDQIADAPESVIEVRGGAGAARLARFDPAPGGGPALDGSLTGWEACDPIKFASGPTQTVEVRTLYDPAHIYLRWKVRLGHKFEPRALNPPDRVFTHDRAADTLGFYLQTDPEAAPGAATAAGRPGDVRFVMGVFKDGDAVRPAVLGMYPKGSAGGIAKPTPLTYSTPVGSATFAHVGLVDAVANYKLDADAAGYVLSVAIPRAALPAGLKLTGASKTMANFDANLGGHNRFWWSNADSSASRETFDEPTEARLYPGSWGRAEFIPMDNLPLRTWMAIGPFGDAGLSGLEQLAGRDRIAAILQAKVFPPETAADTKASYEGDLTRTRVSQRTLKWKPVSITGDAVDLATALNWKDPTEEGTSYLETNIYSPAAVEVVLDPVPPVHGHFGMRGWLNGATLAGGGSLTRNTLRLAANQPIKLRVGWNHLLLRLDAIWGSRAVGARLLAPPEVLWQLKVSAEAPE